MSPRQLFCENDGVFNDPFTHTYPSSCRGTVCDFCMHDEKYCHWCHETILVGEIRTYDGDAAMHEGCYQRMRNGQR